MEHLSRSGFIPEITFFVEAFSEKVPSAKSLKSAAPRPSAGKRSLGGCTPSPANELINSG